MQKDDLLKNIAETAYNVGFGAKKHFATYDIVAKVPGLIGFSSTAVGIFALFLDFLSAKVLSAAFIVFGVAGLCISYYDHRKQGYADAGRELTQLFNRLKSLYYNAKDADSGDLSQLEDELKKIENEYYSTCISEQIMFSDWYAHYKFFWQHQIEWLNEQKHFGVFRDKVPLSLWVVLGIAAVGSGLLVLAAMEIC